MCHTVDHAGCKAPTRRHELDHVIQVRNIAVLKYLELRAGISDPSDV